VNLLSPLQAPRHLQRIGAGLVGRTLVEQVWYTKLFLGLRCELESLPSVRSAKVEVRMEPRSTETFRGFEQERSRARGVDYLELLLRIGLCEAGVQTLYAAEQDGAPVYAQWLVRAADQDRMHRHAPGRYPRLEPDEALLEGAYTFQDFRRMGVMADGMAQLLRIAAEEEARAVITYVAADNVPSLRGCAAVGFVADHTRESIRRVGLRRSPAQPLDDRTRELWRALTA
jgi:hypothetical protein